MINLENLENILKDLSSRVEDKTSITLCGGASLVINYQSRESTRDVGCVSVMQEVKQAASTLANTYGLDFDWLNDNVCATQSYSKELLKHKTFYKKFGKLTVYTITGLPLLCMKLVSWRPNSSDYEDCTRIIEALKTDYTVTDVYDMLNTIYGTNSVLSVDAERFLNYEFGSTEIMLDTESADSYAFSLDAGDITINDIPEPFRKQVMVRLGRLRAKTKVDTTKVACAL